MVLYHAVCVRHIEIIIHKMKINLPFGFGCSVSLSPVLEPVADLSGGETRLFGELSLLSGGRIGVLGVPLPQHHPRLLLEAVACLLTVPYRSGEGELASDTILAHSSQWLASETFCLDVVCLQPELLHLGVGLEREVVGLDDAVELLKVSLVEGDQSFGLEDALILLYLLAGGEAPEEAGQPLDVATLLEYVANASDLLLTETVRIVGDGHGGSGELVTIHDVSCE